MPAPPLDVLIVTPAAARSGAGNRVSAVRIAALLRSLGHRVRVRAHDDGAAAHVLIALHAYKSAAAVRAFAARSAAPVLLVLAGTDVYPRLDDHADTRSALARADRLVALQPAALAQLPAALRPKTRVVLQSATAPPPAPRASDTFDVAVLAHVRAVKEPLLAAAAAALLPPDSPVRVHHAGALLDPALLPALQAAATAAGGRYRWLGALPRRDARALLARSRLLVVPSRHEGGANVVSEALAAGVPVLATDVPGNTGLLGERYDGLFPPGDAVALAAMLQRAAGDPGWLAALTAHGARLAPQFAPARERAAWAALLAELGAGDPGNRG